MRILLSFLLLAACGPGSPDAPPASPTPAEPCSEGTCSLFADLDRWTFEGLAADVARGLPEAAETTVLLEDFEEKRRRDLTKGRARIVGDHYAYLRTVGRVTRDLARSLVLAAALILVTLAAAFRSWRLGLASMVPTGLAPGPTSRPRHPARSPRHAAPAAPGGTA